MSSCLEEIFAVKNIDPEWTEQSGGKSKPFTRVSRVHFTSENYENMDLILDINTQVYDVPLNQRFTFVLAHTLREDGVIGGTEFDQSGEPNMADKFEYVCHGKVYKCHSDEDDASSRLSVYVSFGGLLMRLRGDSSNLLGIELDQYIYLLMRKI